MKPAYDEDDLTVDVSSILLMLLRKRDLEGVRPGVQHQCGGLFASSHLLWR